MKISIDASYSVSQSATTVLKIKIRFFGVVIFHDSTNSMKIPLELQCSPYKNQKFSILYSV